VAYTILFRRGTESQWIAANPVLRLGELGYVTDIQRFKIGDGNTPWNSLEYKTASLIDGKIPADQIPDFAKIDVNQVSTIAQRNLLTAQSGDIAVVAEENKTYIFDGNEWVEVLFTANLSGYATEQYVIDSIDNLNLENYTTVLEVSDLIDTAIDNQNLPQYATINFVNQSITDLEVPDKSLFEIAVTDESIIFGQNIPPIASSSAPLFNYLNSVGFGNNVFTSSASFVGSNTLSRNVYDSTAVGNHAIGLAIRSSENTALGFYAINGGGFRNVGVGNFSLFSMKPNDIDSRLAPNQAKENTAVGYRSMFNNEEGFDNVAVGANSMLYSVQGNENVALGANSLIYYDNQDIYLGDNSVALGASATVPGNNVVKIGNSLQTAITYGAVHNVADERDVADIRDTELGLDFINELRPVDFKWNYREDYDIFESPGSENKRPEYHHGLIAQEVKLASDDLGKNFGGYIDFAIAGNVDIQTLGYQEFIPPMIKAIQEVDTRLVSAEGDLSTVAALSASVASLSAAYAELLVGAITYETYELSSVGSQYFVSASPGDPNPTITLVKGRNYRFVVDQVSDTNPFALRESNEVTNQVFGTTNNDPVNGRSGSSDSTFIFYSVPQSPTYTSIIYQSVNNSNMRGNINLVDPE